MYDIRVSCLTDLLNTCYITIQKNAFYSREDYLEDYLTKILLNRDYGPRTPASRTDRIAKYNQLLRIEERLGASSKYGE